MVFNENGMLPAGLHDYSAEQIFDELVEGFPASQSRLSIFKSLIEFCKNTNEMTDPCEIWLDGSYVTQKINPNDIDIVVFLQVEDYIKVSTIDIQKIENVDFYYAMAISEHNKSMLSPTDFWVAINNRNYWKGRYKRLPPGPW